MNEHDTVEVARLIAAGHQCDMTCEGYYWARLIVRMPPRHLPQPGPYPKLCAPSVVRLLLPETTGGAGVPLVMSMDTRGHMELYDWLFLARITEYHAPEFTRFEMKALWAQPIAIQLVIDYHDNQIAEADAIGWTECIAPSEARQAVLVAHRNAMQIAGGDRPGDLHIDSRYAKP